MTDRHSHLGVRFEAAQNLTITARFGGPSVVELDSYWPAILDGLLAWAERQRRPPADERHVDDLPLVRRRVSGGRSSQWYWLASIASPLDADGELLDEYPGRLERRPGPIAWHCAGLSWRAVGDQRRIEGLLPYLTHVGNRHRRAAVTKWAVSDDGAPNDAWATWLPSDLIGRPIPARAADELGVTNAATVDGAIRPPYWRPPTTTDRGRLEREWRPVIAPWTRRPDV